jgi:polysaccharide biosynthesis transport protein
LRNARTELVGKYSAKSSRVRAKQAEINRVNRQIRELEKEYPELPTQVPGSSSVNKELDPAAEAAHLAGLKAKKEALAVRLKEVQQKIQQFAKIAPQINDLERERELEETNYKYFQATLEKARVDEALDPSKIPNISAVQRPSPPKLDTAKRNKVAIILAFSGLGLAIALILFKELIFDCSIRRPIDVEKFVGQNVLMSIPYISNLNGSSRTKANGETAAIVPAGLVRKNIAPWDSGHFIRPYSEAIRDRLGLYFEVNNLTHKPKLVGVAGFSQNSGASTLAAGLASALSETNDGKVLLVDVNLGPDQVHPFFKGKPAYSLNTALKPSGAIDAAAENLYLATVGSPNAGPAQLGLKKFFDLMPNLKASDFDYIIFDMPQLDQISPTWGMAAFMDKMLVVVESETNSRDVVQRGYKALVNERDNVSIVLNKVHSYTPKRLKLET